MSQAEIAANRVKSEMRLRRIQAVAETGTARRWVAVERAIARHCCNCGEVLRGQHARMGAICGACEDEWTAERGGRL